MFTSEKVAKPDLGNLASPVDQAPYEEAPRLDSIFCVILNDVICAQTIAEHSSWFSWVIVSGFLKRLLRGLWFISYVDKFKDDIESPAPWSERGVRE